MTQHKISDQQILEWIRSEHMDEAIAALVSLHPADIADIIEQAPSSLRGQLFDALKKDIQPEVLAELEHRSSIDILETLTNREISDIVEDMPPDDAADVLGELPPDRSEKVLEMMEKEESADVRKLLAYPEDTAGGIMTTDVVAMREDQTVNEALEAIAYLDTSEQFVYAHIVDADNRMIGYVDIWELLREKQRDRPLRELVHRDIVTATVEMDQEEVVHLIKQYDLSAIPVLDEAGRLVGRITTDDIIDAMEEEASEDIFRLAGSDDADLSRESPLTSCRVRLPWLFITLAGGFITSTILRHFNVRISTSGLLILAAFVPIVLAMGGNTGIQSSTLVVRRLALGELHKGRVIRLLTLEAMTGILMGIICGTLIAGWAYFLIGHSNTPPEAGITPVYLAVAVGTALFSAMTFAAVFGAFVPLVLDKFDIDPAVASGPFVSIANDISALLIYFGITLLFFMALP